MQQENWCAEATGWICLIRSVIMAMTQGVGAHLTNDQKRAHLTDIGRALLIDDACIREILPPDE
jgi:hypothetical protein